MRSADYGHEPEFDASRALVFDRIAESGELYGLRRIQLVRMVWHPGLFVDTHDGWMVSSRLHTGVDSRAFQSAGHERW
jgi:hypothetical protein